MIYVGSFLQIRCFLGLRLGYHGVDPRLHPRRPAALRMVLSGIPPGHLQRTVWRTFLFALGHFDAVGWAAHGQDLQAVVRRRVCRRRIDRRGFAHSPDQTLLGAARASGCSPDGIDARDLSQALRACARPDRAGTFLFPEDPEDLGRDALSGLPIPRFSGQRTRIPGGIDITRRHVRILEFGPAHETGDRAEARGPRSGLAAGGSDGPPCLRGRIGRRG